VASKVHVPFTRHNTTYTVPHGQLETVEIGARNENEKCRPNLSIQVSTLLSGHIVLKDS